MREEQRQKLHQMLTDRPLGARELMLGLNVSQPTLSRLISSMADDVVVMGKGRATRYALPRTIHGQKTSFPVYCIDPRGDARLYGKLIPLQGGGFWWEDGAGQGEIHATLPWFLQDLLFSGFSGRSFAYRQSEELGLPRKMTDWNESDELYALSRRGEDRLGNLMIGDESLSRYFDLARENIQLIAADARSWRYPHLAQKTLAGEYASAQLPGEHPKFATCIEDRGSPCHMLVKFSPAAESHEARRYADLLICEHLALEAIRIADLPAARSRLINAGKQFFLEVKRFDRRGTLGRLPAHSLRAVHTRLSAPCDNWIDAALRLQKADIVNQQEADKLCWLALFSDLIGNTNQHFGNLSLIPHQQGSCLVAPAYGIRPALYEPVAGEISPRLFTPPPVRNEAAHLLDSALDAAILFWKSAAVDKRISGGFRQICYENCELLKLRAQGPKLVI